MLKYFIVIIKISYLISCHAFSDMNIIENGKILERKPYSINEATLIVSKSKKIYICSISNHLTKCILSNKQNEIN